MMLLWVAFLGCCVSARVTQLRRDNFEVVINRNSLATVHPVSDSLDHLDLSGLGLREIHEDAFHECGRVKNLSLANNRLRQLPVMVFRGLVDLEYLSLANNGLLKFQYAFGSFHWLKTIDIRNNGIQVLQNGSFYGLFSDAEILMDGNHFGQLQAHHFEEPFPLLALCMANDIVHYLAVVSADEIKKQAEQFRMCKTRFRPLLYDIVSLGLEGIKGFEKGWYCLNHLRITLLDLQLNEIHEITSELLNDLPESLTRVNLAWNRIEKLETGVIHNMNLQELDLRGNRISTIDGSVFVNTSLWKLELSSQDVKNV